jgi:hypothetical protein
MNERQMTVSSANRTALFIDGANLYSTAKALGFDIDYKLLLKEFQSHRTLVRGVRKGCGPGHKLLFDSEIEFHARGGSRRVCLRIRRDSDNRT